MKIALTLPGGNFVASPDQLKGGFTDLTSLLTPLLNMTFYIATFIAFYYLVWGTFQYIIASGKKEELAKARQKISWALVGLIVVFAAYLIARFVAYDVFKPGKGGLPF